MLKKNKKQDKLSQILNKKFTNQQELHEKLKEMNIYFENFVTRMKETYYLVRIDNINYACILQVDNKNRIFLTR